MQVFIVGAIASLILYATFLKYATCFLCKDNTNSYAIVDIIGGKDNNVTPPTDFLQYIKEDCQNNRYSVKEE